MINENSSDEQCVAALREKYGDEAAQLYIVYRGGAFRKKTPYEAYQEVAKIAEWS